MKNLIITAVILIAAFNGLSVAQNKPLIFGAEGAYFNPVGKLHERFNPTNGGAVYAGIQTSEKWKWLCRAEYFKFDKLNDDKLQIMRKLAIDGSEQNVKFPLQGLVMNLDVAGITLDAKYCLIRAGIFEASLDAGFGIYKWKFVREKYDTVKTSITGLNSALQSVSYAINGIRTSQEDISGGFNAGLELVISPMEYFSVTVAGAYRNIIGELYPALEFDMENVSTFQMLDLRAGIRLKL